MSISAYCGIDVAFAKKKTLPVAVCIRHGAYLRPLALRSQSGLRPPRGSGNRAALDSSCVREFAEDVATYLHRVEREFDVSIARIAIDAPREPAPEGRRRACELAMDSAGWSCFATPSRSEWEAIRHRVDDHLARGRTESTLPHANQLWMLVGFSLFERLERDVECLEVFPSAIVRGFESAIPHKTTADGYLRQVAILRRGVLADDDSLATSSFGNRHDRLDALLSAWVAGVDDGHRVPFGDGLRDTIWGLKGIVAA
jgi:predicted nuclease with RNAse H fold